MSASEEHFGPVIAERQSWKVIDCESCGWAHLQPFPDRAELALMYERTYYQEHNPGWLDKDRSEKVYWDLEHSDKIADWSNLLGQTSGKLLDVGCSGGLLMEYAVRQGWKAEGIEPSDEAVQEARKQGLTVHHASYGEVRLPDASFDVVHSKLVMEHLPDPRDFIEWASRILVPGGIFSAQVPNDFNALQLAARDLLGKESWWVAAPFHINYFSFDSLESLLVRSGFEPVGRDSTYPVESFLLMGEDYVGNDRLGKSVHERRMALESHLEPLSLRRPFHSLLSAHGVGREAIVHARWNG